MNRRIFVIVGLALVAGVAQAQLNETFTYADGPLTTRAGSPWTLWDPASSADSNVVSGVAVTQNGSDNMTSFANTLQTTGSSINYSFDFLSEDSVGAGTNPNFNIVFAPATSPWASGTNDNYNNSFGAVFNQDAASGGMASVAALEGQGTTGFFYYASGFMTTGTFHHFNGTVTRTATGATHTMLMDGNLIFTGTFALTDARGINSVEFYKSNTGTNNGRFDNIVVTAVPEPATLIGLAIGGLALLKKRRK